MQIVQQQNDVLKIGENTSKKATINQNKIAKLQYILTRGLYQDPIGSIINEWSANAIDAVVQSGKNPLEKPIIVNITNDKFCVKDEGIGISKDDFINVCMNYLSSTKESDNQSIGHFGLGMKVFMALDRSAVFTINKDNVQCKFIAYQGEEFMEYDLVYEKPTDEENSVLCEISIKNWSEKSEFIKKAKKRLSYYDTVLLYIDGQLIENKIIRSDDWQYSNNSDYNFIHITLKDVVYELNYEQLGIDKIDIPIALKFNLDSGLTPTPSRESLIYNTFTKELILSKIKEVATWFVEKYNLDNIEEKYILDIWDTLSDTNRYVKLEEESFKINQLIPYSSIGINELRVFNININAPKYYYDNRTDFSDEYEVVSKIEYGKYSTKHIRHSCKIYDLDIQHVLVSKTPTGKIKTYLQSKYKKRTNFIVKNFNRRLNNGTYSYKNTLHLENYPKSEWRKRILEYQYVEKQFKNKIIDETNVESSVEFIEWDTKKKQEQKENRKHSTYSGNYKVLAKQKGEVTLGIIGVKSIGKGYKVDKKTFNIESFHKIPKITVCFTEKNKERAKDFYHIFKSKVVIAVIGKNEFNKIKTIHNVMTEEEFLKSKSFKRTITAIVYDDLVSEYENLYSRKGQEIIKNHLDSFSSDVQILKNYSNSFGKRINSDLEEELLAYAKEHNVYDFEYQDVYNRVKNNIEKYDFINLLQEPRRYDEEGKANVNRLIAQILLFRKKYHNQYEDLEIEVRPKTIIPIEEVLQD